VNDARRRTHIFTYAPIFLVHLPSQHHEQKENLGMSFSLCLWNPFGFFMKFLPIHAFLVQSSSSILHFRLASALRLRASQHRLWAPLHGGGSDGYGSSCAGDGGGAVGLLWEA
ncbi:hypothetical protein V8G54_000915, partial [Vigna mungo]